MAVTYQLLTAYKKTSFSLINQNRWSEWKSLPFPWKNLNRQN